MKPRNRIAILICYMGELPWYTKYFFYTCGYNLDVDFYLICDNQKKYELPANVKIINKTLEEICNTAEKKIGMRISLSFPYKLCDFKPAYGLIFEDLIERYDFWGYGDLDIIFGNIRSFITDDLLDNHDVISVRHDFLTGYFQLFKNNDFTRNLFRYSKDYEKVFTSDRHFCFDETNFTHKEFTNNVPIPLIICEIDSMMHVVKRLENQGLLKPYFDFLVVEGLAGHLTWEKGHLYYKDKFEILLYHLIMFKKNGFEHKNLKQDTEKFRISTTRIY
ncbi:DUF6625 family protein [Pedobacter namyangjuensis]|uniref:DUF6625 family protein n=1 Tax=Pedobacter namyangjuensis TaxID=600626 RepID=UPI0013B417A5|nr:DUF6625 family protein [Pedobacter namyangjuensis]